MVSTRVISRLAADTYFVHARPLAARQMIFGGVAWRYLHGLFGQVTS
jgi:hypothetical protein